SGPTGRRCGRGHSVAPALQPAGSFHWIRVGKPESPGTCQYVCQCSSCLRRRPATIGWPGTTASVAGTSSAPTLSVCTAWATALCACAQSASVSAVNHTFNFANMLPSSNFEGAKFRAGSSPRRFRAANKRKRLGRCGYGCGDQAVVVRCRDESSLVGGRGKVDAAV